MNGIGWRLGLAAVVVGLLGAAEPAVAQVTVFSYSGGEQTYAVPVGVAEVSIAATGAAGGGPTTGLTAGSGAVVSGMVSVTPGEVLYVEVGGVGGLPAGGFNGGGVGGTNTNVGISEFGGGGASDVRLVSSSVGGSLDSRVIVAAGGGGSATPAAAGGNAGAPGTSAPGSSVGGDAGTQTAGGTGGCDVLLTGCGSAGTLGLGGAGGVSGTGASAREGSGGGGGLYGGGGGGGVLDGAVGGGGGGSSLVPVGGSMTIASLTTPPSVSISPVPPPSCQDVAATTPFEKRVTVQLKCTEFGGKPLTYAIVGPPAHGTLSAVGPTVQLTYTPDAGFSGTDSFTYDASSTNGTASAQVSITVGANPVGVASARRAHRIRNGAEVSVACGGATRVAHCRLTVALSLTESSAGHEPMALSASRSKRPTRSKKVVTVGQTSAVIAAGLTEVIRVHLNARGRRLLSTRSKLRVALIVTQATVAGRHVVSRQTLTLTASPSNHRKKP